LFEVGVQDRFYLESVDVYVTWRDIELKYTDSKLYQKVAATVKWIQIDNQLYGGIFPLIAYPSVVPKTGKEMEAHPIFRTVITRVKDDSYGVLYIKYFTFLLQQLTIEIDEDFIFALLDFTKVPGASWTEEQEGRLAPESLAMEWREEHEDQLLHETLLCLKGLCTTERAMGELAKVADELFPALMAMLFDDEKKGPAEYTTRTIVINVLCEFYSPLLTCNVFTESNVVNFLAAASPEMIEKRAGKVLAYLGEPTKSEEATPVDFVLGMRASRPYKLWCRELTHVTKEVFWIFLHHLNVVPRPQNTNELSLDDSDNDLDTDERAKALAATYTQRHFPGTRPPVPAAPYIGGVEWDATTYITAHLDLLNGLIASISTASARNALRAELQASGFEKVLGATLRTCKEKFYSGVHGGLRAWVAAAAEDGWETRYVREGPTQEEQAKNCSPKKSPKKKDAAPKIAIPNIEAPKLDLGLMDRQTASNEEYNDGWLG
jgi:hypothetical protein